MSLPAWFELLKELGLPKRVLPRDVRTRWNSTFRMLDAALEYKKAIVRMTGDLDMGFRELELTREEWEIATHLRDVLKVSVRLRGAGHVRALRLPNTGGSGLAAAMLVSLPPPPPYSLRPLCTSQLFDDTTKFFSRDGTPNLATVIPAMDHIDSKLADFGLDARLPAAVRAAATLGKQVINYYYNATDDNVINRIAMGE